VDNHSSGPEVAFRPQATNPKTARATPWFSYLVLLRVGFTLPSALPRPRCALTAPFHPYRPRPAVYFLLHWPWARAPQTLSGTLPCGARTFLQFPREPAIIRLTRRHS